MNFLWISVTVIGLAVISATVSPFVKGMKMAWWLYKNDRGLLLLLLSEKDPVVKDALFDAAEEMYDNRRNNRNK